MTPTRERAPDAERYRGISFEGISIAERPKPAASRAVFPTPAHPAIETLPTRLREPALNSVEVAFVQEVLLLSNLDPAHYRIAPLVRRITACLRVLRAATIEKARLILADHPKRVPLALNALLIGTTCFFRDSLVFSHIENRLVPELLRRHRHPRVWSAACSDGAELYSVAMLFAEHGPLAKGQFYGSDCRPYAIEIAKAGRYGKNALTHVALDYARQHFTQGADFVDVNDALKAATHWDVGDIFASEPSAPWDLILCRNLAIYLDPGPARQLWARLADSLSSGGALVVGKAEKITLPELYRDGPCLYRKH